MSLVTFALIDSRICCRETGKLHQVKLKDLSREDCESLTKDDLVKGSELIVGMKGKLYPVQFVQFKDMGQYIKQSEVSWQEQSEV